MKNISVVNMKGKSAGKFSLDEDYFNGKVKHSLLQQVILMYLANIRSGTASTKTRKFVRGGGRKPWRQKGTGRARAGSIRSPLWRGGGVTFGPQPRRFGYKLPRNIKNLALAHSLNGKIKDNELVVVDKIALEKPKTGEFFKFLRALKADDKSLVIIERYNAQLLRAACNIPELTVKAFNDINAYDVLKHKKVIFSKQALENLIKLRKK